MHVDKLPEDTHPDVKRAVTLKEECSLSSSDEDSQEEHILDRTGQDIGDPESEDPYLDPSLLEIDYTNTRLRRLPPLRKLCQVRSVNLRQNLLNYDALDDLQYLISMTHLDLYDNRISSLDNWLAKCTSLINLDLSFNLIRKIDDVKYLTKLEELWLANNKIRRIMPGLENCSNLRILELGANRLKKIENLTLSSLQSLWMGRNRISRIEGLDNLRYLKKLDLQANRLTNIEGLSNLSCLEELYLSHNHISQIDGISHLTSLKILDLSNNWIEHLENLKTLTSLEDLWMNDNRIGLLEETKEIADLTTLTTLYLERNPCADDVQYRVRVRLMLPQLKQLDATPIYHSGYPPIFKDEPTTACITTPTCN